ncbi:MAG TPA: PEP-CTERM sorting domain-containing protein [Candidatus Sulfotelmatobacter sp.]|nr:PEP-CTERM sorting domain-containing protein [Candidatus Sulfotelmatobacter sp.]
MNLARLSLLALAAILVLGAAQVVLADGVSGSINLQETGWNANASLTTSGTTSGTWNLVVDFVNGTALNTDINSFAIQLFSAAGSESFSLSTATVNGSASLGNWEFFTDDKLNNGGTPDCSSNTVKGWICGDTAVSSTLTPFVVAAGTTTEFIVTGTFSAPGGLISSLDMMASGCENAGTCFLDGGTSNGNKWAVSGTMGGTTAAPEPSSIMLLGSGLSFLGMVIRRRKLTA